jgi:glycosyltransferase involved in cell wall biosynthesis
MRIGVNCFSLQAHIGGMNQYFINLFNEILGQDTKNEYIFYYSEQNINELRKLNSEFWGKEGILLKNPDEVANHLKRIDLYFCPLGILWPRPLPLPMVVTIPDIQEVFYPDFFTEIDHYLREYHYRGSTRIADRVVTLSHFSKETLVDHHGISPEKVVVVYPSIDQLFFKSKEQQGGNSPPIPFNEFILYPANHWLHKNHDGLLKAIKYLKEEKKTFINVLLTGHEVAQGYPLKNKVNEYGLSEQISIMGYLPREELAALYARAKMVVFPSLFEGYGIPLVEAMAAGCPVAASSVTSLPEIGGDAVEYFDPTQPMAIAKCIELLWNNPEKRKELVQKGHKRIERFSASNLVQSHNRAFEEAQGSFSFGKYYWHRWWTHPSHRWKIHRKYRKSL